MTMRRSNTIQKFVRLLATAAVSFLPAGGAAQINTNVFVYGSSDGEGAVYRVDYYGQCNLLKAYLPKAFPPGWTNIVNIVSPSSSYVLFYNAANGAARLGKVDGAGTTSALRDLPAGSFSIGWTHLVSYFDGVLFYNSNNGSLAYGRLDANLTPFTVKSFPAAPSVLTGNNRLSKVLTTNPRITSFSDGWTQVVTTLNGVLFYNSRTGAGEFGRFDTKTGNYTFLNNYAAGLNGPLSGGYSQGWTHVVSSPNGILFYNANYGRALIGRIDPAGQFIKLNSYDAGALSTGWTHISNTRNGIFFYSSKYNSRFAVGRIDGLGLFTTTASDKVLPGNNLGTNYYPLSQILEVVPR
jgi:hypothetical protein